MNTQPLLEARDVGWQVGTERILDHVSLALHEGEILTVIGPNGAGKTSLLRILMRLLAPSSGCVWREPGLRIGYMPQRLMIDASLPMDVGRFLRLAEREEVADLFILLIGTGIAADFDLKEAFWNKMEKIMQREAKMVNGRVRVSEFRD